MRAPPSPLRRPGDGCCVLVFVLLLPFSDPVEYPILAAGRRWRYGQARRHSNLNEGEPIASRRIDLKIRCNTSVIGCIRCVLGVIGCVSCVLGVIGVYYLYSPVIGVIFCNSCNSFWR